VLAAIGSGSAIRSIRVLEELYMTMRLDAFGVVLGIALFVASSANATVLYDNGPVAGNAGACDQQTDNCGGDGWTIYDDFQISAASTIDGFTYYSYPLTGDFTGDYTGTQWSIWGADPLHNYSSGPVFSGTTLGTASPEEDGSVLITITSLNIDLSAGKYWLGTSNDMSNSNDITTYAFTNNGFADAEQSTDAGVFFNSGNLADAAFTIDGPGASAVPEPSSLSLLVLGLGLIAAAFYSGRRVRKLPADIYARGRP
jgi:hypothetical protein